MTADTQSRPAKVKLPRGRRSHRLWQELVDSAHALLELDACRQYGLITGGAKGDPERCYKTLKDGRERGFIPSPNALENFLLAFEAEERSS